MKFGLHRDASYKSAPLKFYVGHVNIRADRWPWMTRKSAALLASADEAASTKYGWKPTKGMGRFGGGWNYSLGIEIGGSSVMINLLFGFISISWYRPKEK